METKLADFIRDTPDGREADAILRACVHCGFCTATCPTYQLLGDELDGPRGRIYLIKQVLEGGTATASTQLHLDRCLTCRSCETTCPSGVRYGHLADIGRRVIETRVGRTRGARTLRWLLRKGLTNRGAFGSGAGDRTDGASAAAARAGRTHSDDACSQDMADAAPCATHARSDQLRARSARTCRSMPRSRACSTAST